MVESNAEWEESLFDLPPSAKTPFRFNPPIVVKDVTSNKEENLGPTPSLDDERGDSRAGPPDDLLSIEELRQRRDSSDDE